jgi:hypothetical protein
MKLLPWSAPLALSLLGCAQSASVTTADGGAPSVTDAPAASGPCRWRAGAPVVHLVANAHRSLIDARPAEGGAWVLVSDDAGGDRMPELAIERLDATGHRLGSGPVPLPSVAASSASLAVREPSGLRALLTDPIDHARGDCELTRLDAQARPTSTVAVRYPRDGFALTGCRALEATATGFSFLARQVRALDGLSLVPLDAMGAAGPTAPALATTTGQPTYVRAARADGVFALLLREGSSRLTVQAFTASGESVEPPRALQREARPSREFAASAVGDGFLAAWEEAVDTAPLQYGVAVRAIARGGAPGGSPRVLTELGFSLGALSVTAARGDVLLAAAVGTTGPRLVVVPLDADGASRGEAITIPAPRPDVLVEQVRLVATPDGALAVYATDPGQYPNAIVAVPLTCAP